MMALSKAKAQRLLEQEAATLHGMKQLLPESGRNRAHGIVADAPAICVAVLAMQYCEPGRLATTVRRVHWGSSALALVNWRGLGKASVQLHRTEEGWKLASLSMGAAARSLHRAVGKAGGCGQFVAVPNLRLTTLVKKVLNAADRRIQVIDGGLTPLRAGARFTPEALEARLAEIAEKHVDAVKRSKEFAVKASAAAGMRVRRTIKARKKLAMPKTKS